MTLNTKNALVTICLFKEDIFISSFPGKIVFGLLDEGLSYVQKKSFVIFRNSFCLFYERLLEILDDIVKNKESKSALFELDPYIYFYMVSKDFVKFGIEYKTETIFVSSFTLFEFNNLIDCFKELIPSSLLLRPLESSIFHKLSALELKDLIKLDDHDCLVNYFEAHYTSFTSSKFGNVLFILMNFDLVVLLHKLNHLSKTDYRKKYQSLLNPNSKAS